jgi:hypothetical protein
MRQFTCLTFITSVLLAICLMAGGCTTPQVQKETVGQVQIQERGYFTLACYDASGNLKWQETDRANALSQTGEQAILDVFFRNGTAPSTFYLRLSNTIPTATDSLTTLMATEPTTAYGYNPANQALARNSTDWPTLGIATAHYEVQSKATTITANGGTIGPIAYAVIASSSNNTGYPIAYAALAQTRTLSSGDSLQITYKVRLQ